ncbi:MAG: Lrp/AsnC family transcriptional regulator [Actinomycetota bacterium]|nr:Lrp/AsnC family transcriptional regulator [Actinomycetota bacterium]
MATGVVELDVLDVLLIKVLREQPRAGFLELARLTGVSRATVQARLGRLESAGAITGYGPDVDLAATGFPVQALVLLDIAQGDLETVARGLAAIPQVLEAKGVTGDGDVFCRIAAPSHEALQQVLLDIARVSGVVRSRSMVELSHVVRPRVVPLLETQQRKLSSRVTATPRLGGA